MSKHEKGIKELVADKLARKIQFQGVENLQLSNLKDFIEFCQAKRLNYKR